MTASTEYFRPPHATRQHQDVKFFFANQGNMRKNNIQEPISPNNITSTFQVLMTAEFSPIRLSTYLTTRNSDRAFKNFSLQIMFEGKVADLNPRPHRKHIEAANDSSFARTEKLGRWRGIERGMSAKRPGRMRWTRTRHPPRRSMCWQLRQRPD